MPVRCVALLRGINVGTAKRIAMADLRTLFARLGYRDVRTVLNSGNVVFTVVKARAGGEAGRIERAIETALGVTTSVLVLTAGEVADALHDNPLAGTSGNPSRLLLVWLWDDAAVARVRALARNAWSPEAIVVGSKVAYLWCANGISAGRLWTEVNRVVGPSGTGRNLATMRRILAVLGLTGDV